MEECSDPPPRVAVPSMPGSRHTFAEETDLFFRQGMEDWTGLIAQSGGQEKIYLTPAFLHFREEAYGAGTTRIFTLRDQQTRELMGVIPVHTISKSMILGAGRHQFFARRIKALAVLGSVPAADITEHETAQLYRHLLRIHPEVDALYLNAYPASDERRGQLANLRKSGLEAYLQNGVEDCHVIELPPTFQEYESKLSSKKRYNIRRQMRQLEEHAGKLELKCWEQVADVAPLLDVIATLGAQSALRASTLEALARRQLLLSYVLFAGERPVGVIVGKQASGVWHIDNIFIDTTLPGTFSVGTSVLHLVLEHAIGHHQLRKMDFGFGSPGHAFSSTQIREPRARVLLYRTTLRNTLFFGTYRIASRLILQSVNWIKRTLAKRQARPA